MQALPLHSGLIVQLVLVHAVGSALCQWLPEALKDAVPLLQRQLKILLQRERVHTEPVVQPASWAQVSTLSKWEQPGMGARCPVGANCPFCMTTECIENRQMYMYTAYTFASSIIYEIPKELNHIHI